MTPPPGSPLDLLLHPLLTAATALFVLAQVALAVYAGHRWTFLRRDRARGAAPRWRGELPRVTVQLPVYNEPQVVRRLIDAAAALDYPYERLEIQVLDDSTDETSAIAAEAVAEHRARGVPIEHRRRPAREGFKAGALADGLRVSNGELLAVFDADFVPPRDFLRRMVPHFADPAVGMAQARWGHLNRAESVLTHAQAVMLDAHFLLEHVVRMQRGLFFNFNGTAGIWRRACVESSGGWTHDTLTEDLDLSYRAQLAGWRFVFDESVVVPAELPASMAAFQSQQRRWAKGSIQTARKLLPDLWRRPLPLRTKLEATLHLTSNVAYPLLLALALLLWPVLLAPNTLAPWQVLVLQAALLATGIVPVASFLALGQRAGGLPWRRVPGALGAALLLGAGITLNNTRAVLEGAAGPVGDWERTPKRGDGGFSVTTRGRSATAPVAGRTEMVLAFVFAVVSVFVWRHGEYRALPFLALLVLGLGWVGTRAFAESAALRS